MMTNFSNKETGDLLVMFGGPVSGHNYNNMGATTPIAPSISVKVFGTGSIKLQETQAYEFVGNPGDNTFTYTREPVPNTWADIGPTITASSGIVTITPTVDSAFTAIRAVIVGTGDGNAVIRNNWK